MILKKVIVERRLSLGNYEVRDEQGILLKASILPRKLLQNYIKIENGVFLYIILDAEDSQEGKFATKYDFDDNEELWQQREELKKKSKDIIYNIFEL